MKPLPLCTLINLWFLKATEVFIRIAILTAFPTFYQQEDSLLRQRKQNETTTLWQDFSCQKPVHSVSYQLINFLKMFLFFQLKYNIIFVWCTILLLIYNTLVSGAQVITHLYNVTKQLPHKSSTHLTSYGYYNTIDYNPYLLCFTSLFY